MITRRKNYDPLQTSPAPRWLKVFDKLGNEISSQRIEPLADLRQVLNWEAARWVGNGWSVEGDGNWGTFFANRDGVRMRISLTPTEKAD